MKEHHWNFRIFNLFKRKRRLLEDDDDEHIPEELVVEILLRLPLISVYRFRRVCKQWYSLISNPDFLRTHSSPSSPFQYTRKQQQQQLLTIFSTNKSRVEFLPLAQFEDDEDEEDCHRKPSIRLNKLPFDLSIPLGDYKFIDSCNGLFLFEHIRTRVFYNMVCITYYIYNPINKHYFKLPDTYHHPITKVLLDEENFVFDHSRQANLVFDPSISFSYKVIRRLLPGNSRRQYLENMYWQIYSSETGSWRFLSTRIPDPMCIVEFGFRSVLLNGVLYWPHLIAKGDASFCFGVEKESLWCLPLPPKSENTIRSCLYLGETGGGCLRLIERFLESDQNRWADYFESVQKGWTDYFNNLPCSFDIMETEPQQQQDGGVNCTWTVKYRVNVESVYDLFSKEHASVIHCYKTKNKRGNEEEVLLLRLNGRSVVSFSLTGNKFIKEIANPEKTWLPDFTDVFTYIPTPFPV